MHNNSHKITFLCVYTIACCTLLSSCSRYTTWAKKTFQQVETLPNPDESIKQYTKSIRVYDDFRTVLLADALLLSMPVRKAFVDTRACRQAFNDAFYQDSLKKQRQEHDQQISFYLIVGPTSGTVPLLSKTQSSARWNVSLCVDNVIYKPYDLKQIELEPEYQYFLRLTDQTHRDIYVVTFDAPIQDDQKMTLTFTSVNYQASCTWNE